ncbi:MAG: hypothetical protein OEX12_00035 [Gammaproteobacteria bacterium]|nr:hypothetical protein [Gammaproteobacteria bacterium]
MPSMMEALEEEGKKKSTLEAECLRLSRELCAKTEQLIWLSKKFDEEKLKGLDSHIPAVLIYNDERIFKEIDGGITRWYISSHQLYKGKDIFLGPDGCIHYKYSKSYTFLSWSSFRDAFDFLKRWRTP